VIKVECFAFVSAEIPSFCLGFNISPCIAGGNVIVIHSKEEWDKQQADASNAAKVVRFNY
jgi:hypothetical protein